MRAERIYILIIAIPLFSKWRRKFFSRLLCSYSNTSGSLGELESCGNTRLCDPCSHSMSRSPERPLVFLWLDRNKENVFCVAQRNIIFVLSVLFGKTPDNSSSKISVSNLASKNNDCKKIMYLKSKISEKYNFFNLKANKSVLFGRDSHKKEAFLHRLSGLNNSLFQQNYLLQITCNLKIVRNTMVQFGNQKASPYENTTPFKGNRLYNCYFLNSITQESSISNSTLVYNFYLLCNFY